MIVAFFDCTPAPGQEYTLAGLEAAPTPFQISDFKLAKRGEYGRTDTELLCFSCNIGA